MFVLFRKKDSVEETLRVIDATVNERLASKKGHFLS